MRTPLRSQVGAVVLGPLLLAAPLAAQSFNVDFEHESQPGAGLSDAYGGPAFQPGHWQAVRCSATSPLPPTLLRDANGFPTSATVETNLPGQPNGPTCATWTTDDAELYDGIRRAVGQLLVTFRGLSPGYYSVYVCGVDASAGPGLPTEVRLIVPGGGPPAILQNAARCFTAHTQSGTYAVGGTRVVNGELSVRLSGSTMPLGAVQLDYRVGSSFCVGGLNSIGLRSALRATGSRRGPGQVSVTDGRLTLAAPDVPPGASGLFIYSMARHTSAGGYPPLGDGLRCLRGAFGRLPAADGTTSPGVIVHAVDLTAPPRPSLAILPGSTWHFQGVYKDSTPAGFNMTNAVTVTFGP